MKLEPLGMKASQLFRVAEVEVVWRVKRDTAIKVGKG